jgi:type IV secretory pathway ATPase VirB11/archaellum biosynthesis ATPase
VPSFLQQEFIKAWWAGDYGYSASRKMISDILYLCSLQGKTTSIQQRAKQARIKNRLVKSSTYYTQHLLERETLDYPDMVPTSGFQHLRRMHHRLKNERISKERLKRILEEPRFKLVEHPSQEFSPKLVNEWQDRGIIGITPNPGTALTNKGMDALNELKVVRRITESGIGFVKIKEIEIVKPTSEHVYDLSVPGCENFIAGDGGVYCHNSRVQCTFSAGKDIATKGSSFTIRKFTADPLTIVDFMNFGTIPSLMAAYLWLVLEFRNSVLVSGGTATGKTSATNVLSLFLPPELKIISIEDTPEIQLPHEHWVAKIARTGYGPEVGERKRGEITMFDLLKAALRERPDELIVGEVRGKEAYVLFQAMATGHAGLATIHAESLDAVVNRLLTQPISLSPDLLQHLNLIMIMVNAKMKGQEVRRVKDVIEIVGIDPKTEKPIANQIFKWVPAGDYYEFASDKSYLLNKIVADKGVTEKSIWEEIYRRAAILNWLKKQGIRHYKDVGAIISTYYKNPDDILKRVYGSA